MNRLRAKYFAAGLAALVLAAGAYAAYREWGGIVSIGAADDLRAAAAGGALKPRRAAPAGQRELYDERYRFSLFHPGNLSIKSYDEGGGATTIALQDVKAGEGFQVFIVPYKEAQVSEARFRRDAPSGVRNNPKDVTIGGATATSFYSANAMLGDTAEIWFIHGGYLFEVTAPKSQAAWLSEIMQTWQFI
jgi:hypothetical protein